jgi:ribosomal RNA methyltransferase FmrO
MTEPTEDFPLLADLAADLAQSVVLRYRVGYDEALAVIRADWSRRPALLDAASKATGIAEVKRTRVYDDAAAAIKKDIYYRLRRYRSEQDATGQAIAALADLKAGSPQAQRAAAIRAVTGAHVSTAERLPHLAEFFERLVAMVGVPETIVDAGCGVLPLLVPFDAEMRAIREYWALDIDRAAVGAMREYARLRADDRLRPLAWSLAQDWSAAHDAGLPARSELGMLLKVVPVIARQSAGLLTVLAGTPAERLVVSGSRLAMAKHRDIERRETHILRRFFADNGLRELGSFRTPDEVVFLVERAGASDRPVPASAS